MSLGLGHNYLVHLVKHFVGSLDECIDFMKNNSPNSDLVWFELRPLVKIVKGKKITCDKYCCDLVEDGNL